MGVRSDELEDLLGRAATLRVDRPADGTEVRLYVAVDPDTLQMSVRRRRWPYDRLETRKESPMSSLSVGLVTDHRRPRRPDGLNSG